MIRDPVVFDDWHPVASVDDLKDEKPLAARLLEEDLVLWRAGDQVLAWKDLCIHRGTRLSLGTIQGDDRLVCPYHGWVYDADGHCVRIPAHPDQVPPEKSSVQAYQARIKYGLIWVSLGSPVTEVPPFQEWESAAFRKVLCGPYNVQASGPRIVENFLDIAHFPFVHDGILGVKGRPEIANYEAEINEQGVLAKNVQVYQPDPYGTGQGDTVVYTYQVFRPLTAYLAKESDGPRFSILLTITPIAETSSLAWMWLASNSGHEVPESDIIAYQDEIFEQDRPIVESQRPELLPLDLQAELHLRSDRTAIAYRRWLNQLGLTFGSS